MPKPFSAIPGAKGLPIIGSILEYSRFGRYSFEQMHIAKRENYERYGKIYKEKIGRHIVHLFDPQDIEKIYRAEGKYPRRPPLPLPVVAHRRDKELLGFGSLNGESWWRIRKAVQWTMMPPGAALIYLPVQNQVADDFLRFVNNQLDEQNGILNNLSDLLSKYTMEAFGAVCFNVRIGCLQPSLASDSKAYHFVKATGDMFQAVQKTNFAFPWYAIFRTKLYTQFLDASRTCHRIAQFHVDEALNSSTVETEVESQNVKAKNFLETMIDKNSENLTKEEMIQLTIDLFTAGIDSTSNALSFCLYNLAANVEKQKVLIAELDSVLSSGTNSDSTSVPPVTSDALKRMHYLKACVLESFRLNFPVEGGSIRELEKDMILSDYQVPKGTLVSLNHQTMCLQEEYFEKADQYIPERWLSDSGATLRPAPNFVMLPFGYGSRMCIGRRFAEQEIYLALIKVFQKYCLELAMESGIDGKHHLGMINRVFTMPDRPIFLRFMRR